MASLNCLVFLVLSSRCCWLLFLVVVLVLVTVAVAVAAATSFFF